MLEYLCLVASAHLMAISILTKDGDGEIFDRHGTQNKVGNPINKLYVVPINLIKMF